MKSAINANDVLALLAEHQILEDCEDLLPGSDLFAHGLDSMALMQLMFQLEASFGVMIDPSEIRREHFATAEALAAFLQQKTAG